MATQAAQDPIADAYDEILGTDTSDETDVPDQDEVTDEIAAEDDAEASESTEDDESFTAEDEDPETDDESDEGEDEKGDKPELYTVKVDGEELEVDLNELRSGYQRQRDYTQKTQELSEQREALEQDRADLDEQRTKVQSFVDAFDSNPVDVMEKLVTRTSNPTLATAKLLRSLAENGHLEEQFARTFVGDNVVLQQKAGEAESDERYRSLEQKLEQRERQEAQERERQETVAQFERQWTNVVSTDGLNFESPEQEQTVLRTVLQHAVDRQITDLEDAWASYVRKNGLPEGLSTKESAGDVAAKKQTTDKKKRAQSMARRSSSTGQFTKRKPASDEDAIRESLDELLANA